MHSYAHYTIFVQTTLYQHEQSLFYIICTTRKHYTYSFRGSYSPQSYDVPRQRSAPLKTTHMTTSKPLIANLRTTVQFFFFNLKLIFFCEVNLTIAFVLSARYEFIFLYPFYFSNLKNMSLSFTIHYLNDLSTPPNPICPHKIPS